MNTAIIVLRNPPSGSSDFPSTWDVVTEDAGWFTLYPQGREANPGTFLHACLMAQSGSRSAYVLCSPDAATGQTLLNFASASPNAWTLAELRADSSLLAQRMKAAWRNRVSGVIEFNTSMTGYAYADALASGSL